MKKAKYYLPDVSEIYPGFEFEFKKRLRLGLIPYIQENHDYVKNWTQWIFCDKLDDKDLISTFEKLDNYHSAPNTIREINSFIKDGAIRVKCLDGEDFKSLGWNFVDEGEYQVDAYYSLIVKLGGINNNIEFKIRIIGENVTIWSDDTDSSYFEGEIKNKSVLKKILQWTSIQKKK